METPLQRARRLVGTRIRVGSVVKLKVPCIGHSDVDDREHRTIPGAVGRIEDIDIIAGQQGLAVTISMAVDGEDEPRIFNTFDEADPEPRFPFEVLHH